MRRFCVGFAMLLFPLAARAAGAGLAPEEALKRFTPAEGLEVRLAASEPAVRQPICVNFDARGRMWVVQYIQYPHPAGLKPVRVDPYLRTTYDRCPLPPPDGPKGVDKITIFEDPDENGRYRKSKDFVTGLSLATSVEFSSDGVWVLQPPYLLFYPDRDHDDVPDSDPEVVLAGFGMDDTHAVASHLTWGPDGWLYGCQGSTCTARVEGHEFQQAAWRYHPPTKRFEVFSEGGGNTFGLEWDAHGNLFTGTNYAHFVMVHYVQGGYFVKGFAKHGPLHNPYAFGYFDHVPHTGWRGGHVTQLGVIYQGGALPERFNGKWIAPQPAHQHDRLALGPPRRLDLHDRLRRAVPQVDRPLLPPRRHPHRPRRRGLRGRLVRQARQPRHPRRHLGQGHRPNLPRRAEGAAGGQADGPGEVEQPRTRQVPGRPERLVRPHRPPNPGRAARRDRPPRPEKGGRRRPRPGGARVPLAASTSAAGWTIRPPPNCSSAATPTCGRGRSACWAMWDRLPRRSANQWSTWPEWTPAPSCGANSPAPPADCRRAMRCRSCGSSCSGTTTSRTATSRCSSGGRWKRRSPSRPATCRRCSRGRAAKRCARAPLVEPFLLERIARRLTAAGVPSQWEACARLLRAAPTPGPRLGADRHRPGADRTRARRPTPAGAGWPRRSARQGESIPTLHRSFPVC